MPGLDAPFPPAHPRFAAHFTNLIYDLDNANNDDVSPFGTDEGFDELNTWASRLDDLQAHPTLRYMLGEDADEQIEELRHTGQVDGDDILIGQGFTLLRLTGQIDSEGRHWLTEALHRQDGRGGGEEYADMLQDLSLFDAPPAGLASSAKAEHANEAGAQEARWLLITGLNDDQHKTWLRHTTQSIAQDRSWLQWWSTSGIGQLVLYPSLAGPPDRDHTSFDRGRSRLGVVGSSAQLARITWSILQAEGAGQEVPPNAFHTPEVYAGLTTLINRLLREAGEHLRMSPPPPRLPR